MSEKTKQQFLNSIPDSNVDWAAQQILKEFSRAEFIDLSVSFDRLELALFKSWAKDMSFAELNEAIKIATPFSRS